MTYRLPESIATERIQLRQITCADAPALFEEMKRSYHYLAKWAAWVRADLSLEEQEAFCQQSHEAFLAGHSATYGLWVTESPLRHTAGAPEVTGPASSGIESTGVASRSRDFSIDTSEIFVGTLGLSQIDDSIPSACIGYWGAEAVQGRGYISESVRGLIQYLFFQQNFERIWLTCDVLNVASQRVAERSGMQREATLRKARRNPQGELSDMFCYSILRPVIPR